MRDTLTRSDWIPLMKYSGRLFLPLVFSLVLLLRGLVGIALGYGDPFATALCFAFIGVLALYELLFFMFWQTKAKAHFLGLFISVSLYSTVSVIDGLTLGVSTFSPWAFLILASGCLDLGIGFYITASVPLVCGAFEAFGFLSGTFRLNQLLLLLLSVCISLLFRAVRRASLASLYRDRKQYVERDRSLSAMRDAEVEIAARIQRSLLIETPGAMSAGLKMEALTVASSAVDGDFYSFIPYSDTSVDVLVGDVMGKGVPAALLGAALKSSFLRSSLSLLVQKPRELPEPAELVAAVHSALVGELMELESFATLQYSRIDSATCRMDFVDCGHTPILHFDRSVGFCWEVKGTDLPMGFTDENVYQRFSLPLSAGDRLLFYSDGITEAPGESGELFGEQRLSEIVTANADFSPAEIVRRILNTAMFFSSASGFRDDVTCVAVSLEEASGVPERFSRDFPAVLSCIPDLRSFLEQSLLTSAFPLSQSLLSRILIASVETASNAIRHGMCRPGVPRGQEEELGEELAELACEEGENLPFARLSLDENTLRCECLYTVSWISIRLIYRGVSFPWHRKTVKPDIALLPDSGMGLSVINETASSVFYANGPENIHMACVFFDR